MAMATASFTSVFMFLHSLVEWLGGGISHNQRLHAAPEAKPPKSLGMRARAGSKGAPGPTEQASHKTPALRVIRFVEPTEAPVRAGRMVIFGRLADVCAELDRLAALESRR